MKSFKSGTDLKLVRLDGNGSEKGSVVPLTANSSPLPMSGRGQTEADLPAGE